MRLRLRDRWKLWRWRTAGHVVTEQSCRRCGYPVRDLEGTICPECGAERYHVGTIGPLRPLVQRWQIWLAVWWLSVAVFAVAADPLVLGGVPRQLSYHEDYLLTPHSKLYGPLPFRRIGYSFGWPKLGPYPKSPTVSGTSATPIPPSAFGGAYMTVIDIDCETGRGGYAITAILPSGASDRGTFSGTVSASFMLTWLERVGVNAREINASRGTNYDPADVLAEAAELAQFALAPTFDPQAYQSLKHFDVTVKPAYSAAEPHPEAALAARCIIWGVIGGAGSLLIYKWHRRKAKVAAS